MVLSVGTLSNYFAHAAHAIFRALRSWWDARAVWPSPAEREAMRGPINEFPDAFVFVDGSKVKCNRPSAPETQEKRYDGHHKFHCFAVLVWVDVFGSIIPLYITLEGTLHDRSLFNCATPLRGPEDFFSCGEHAVCDTGLIVYGPIVCPFKKNQGFKWVWRTMFNKVIRKQRICNEWGIIYINNRHRLFVGVWPFAPEFFLSAMKLQQ